MNNDIPICYYWASLKDEDKKINKAQYRNMSLSQSGGSFCHPHLIIHKLSFMKIYLFNIKYSASNKNQVIFPFKRYCFRAILKTKKCLQYNLTPFLLMVTFYVATNHNSGQTMWCVRHLVMALSHDHHLVEPDQTARRFFELLSH